MNTTRPNTPAATRSRSTPSAVLFAALVAAGLATSSSQAANGFWNTTNGNWSDTANWWTTAPGTIAVGVVPVTANTAFFNGDNVNGNQTVYLNGNQAASTLTFANTGSTTILGGNSVTPANQTLTLSGIAGATLTVNAGAGNVTFGDVAGNAAAVLALDGTSSNTVSNLSSRSTLTFNSGITNNTGAARTLAVTGTSAIVFNGVLANNASNVAGVVNVNVTNTGLTTLAGNNTFTGTLTLGANSKVVLAGSNTLTGTVAQAANSSLRLAHADALGAGTVSAVTTNTNSTLIFGSDTPITNNTIAVNGGQAIGNWSSLVLDRNTAGAAVDQTIGSLTMVNQTGIRLSMGSKETSSPSLTVTGNTTFGSSNASKISQLVANDGANFVLNNVTTAGGGFTGSQTNTLYLDGNAASTGNKIKGVISNTPAITGGPTAPTWSGTSGSQTATVTANAGLVVGQRLSGITGITDGTIITGISATTITLSQATTGAVSGAPALTFQNIAAIQKQGAGTWTLSGANTYTGTTTVNAGTLALDFSAAGAPTSDILYNGFAVSGTGVRPTVTVSGGNLQLTGKGSGGNNMQNLSTLQSLANNSGKVTVGGGALGSTVTLQAATLTLNGNSVLDFNGMDANNIINAASLTASTVFSNRSTVNGYSDFAKTDASKNILAAGTSITVNSLIASAPGGTAAFLDSSDSSIVTRSADLVFRGMRLSGAGTLDLNTKNLQAQTASNSAILYNGAATYTITNGTLASSATNTATEFDFYTKSGATLNLTTSAAINNTGTGLTAILTAGEGTVSVAGAKNYTGVTRILGGTYSIDTLANGGTASGLGATAAASGNLIINGGTLKYTGSSDATTDRIIQIGSAGATLDASGVSGTATFTAALGAPLVAAGSTSLTLAGSNTGANTFSGILANGVANGSQANGYLSVTKSGTGTWVLGGANTYSGGTYLNEGTLAVTNASSLGSGGFLKFGGGTLQYSGITTDFSGLFKNSTSAIAIDTNGQAVTFASGLDGSNIGGLAKSGSGTLTLSGANSYTGGTTVTAGNLSFGSSYTLNGANSITVAATGIAGTNYATISSTAGTLTFGGTLGINLTASLTGVETFKLFQTSGGTLAGSFTSVSVTGSYLASLTNTGGIWTGSGSGFDFTFNQANGNLTSVVSAVPEPAAYATLAGLGILILAAYRRRDRKLGARS